LAQSNDDTAVIRMEQYHVKRFARGVHENFHIGRSIRGAFSSQLNINPVCSSLNI